MDDDMVKLMNKLKFIEQLMPYVADENALSRIRVDLHDLFEICTWFIGCIEKNANQKLTSDQLESFLIDLDINFVQHVDFHVKSLRSEIKLALNNFPDT